MAAPVQVDYTKDDEPAEHDMTRTPHRFLRDLLGVAAVVAALVSTGAHAQALAYIEASSELDDGKPASFAYNLVDGKDTTAWCTKPNPAGEDRLVFGFTKSATISELGMVVGAVKGGKLDKRRHRAREVVISDGRVERIIPMKDTHELQVVKLDPPAKGRMIVVQIRQTYEGEPGTPLCVGEIHLKGRRAHTGAELARQVRSLPTPARRMLHSWVDAVDAPERSLQFALDGTFSYDYTPFIEGKPVRLRGKWKASHRALTLEIGSKSYHLKKVLSRIEGENGTSEQLTLSGDGPHPSLNHAFVIAPPTME